MRSDRVEVRTSYRRSRLPSWHSLGSGSSELATLLEGLLQVTSHVESVLGVLVASTLEQGLEALDGGLKVDELAWVTSEDFGHVEWL